MNTLQAYTENQKLSDLICDNYSLLLVMSRFDIKLGFGDKTVKEVCEQNRVDTKTFLAVANFMEKESYSPEDYDGEISIESLIHYLKQAHSYFLDFNLPAIRKKLSDALDCVQDDIARLIMKFFDEYAKEVHKHMGYENEVVFEYVNALLKGEKPKEYSIAVFAKKHNQIETKLTELKNIIIKYYPAKANNNLLNSALFDIYSCEKDLCAHCRVEDYIFVPLIVELEKKHTEHGK